MRTPSRASPSRQTLAASGTWASRCRGTSPLPSEALYQGILAKVQARVGQWAGHHLSFMGRAYIAKQILMSLFTYHAIFIPVPRLVLRQLSSAIYTFVAANRPAAAGQAYLFPRREVCSLDIAQGGINLLAIPEQITALRAKVIGRLMEPEQLPWKAYFDHHMYRTRVWLATAGPAATAANLPHVWQLGRFLISSSLDLRRASLPPRVQSYIAAYRLLAPHRIVDPCGLPHDAIMREPLFHNRRICDPGTHLPLAWHEWARRGRGADAGLARRRCRPAAPGAPHRPCWAARPSCSAARGLGSSVAVGRAPARVAPSFLATLPRLS